MADDKEDRTIEGRFVPGVSGNKIGRPKGSKNKVTLLKLMAEEAVRDRNLERMQQVADKIVTEALNGDKDCMKLIWQSIVSKGSIDDRTTSSERVQITIKGVSKDATAAIEQKTETTEPETGDKFEDNDDETEPDC